MDKAAMYRRNNLMRRYGLTPIQYDRMAKDGCQICGTKSCGTGRRLAVDHNHKTGKVRGVLCTSCNNGLGRFDDRPDLLLSAVEYLKGA